jgi:hypothetical protein
MTYARMGHVHVDIGYRFVSLGSGGGGGTRLARRSTARTAVASSRSTESTTLASRPEGRAQRLAESRELAPEAVLRLAQKD